MKKEKEYKLHVIPKHSDLVEIFIKSLQSLPAWVESVLLIKRNLLHTYNATTILDMITHTSTTLFI